MMLAAELHAARGNLARALSAVERVLARDIDAPGARERHERWSAQLGRAPRAARVDGGATVVAPHAEGKLDLRLLREVARGGAGTVYEAEDDLLGRRVAFKLYHRSDQLRGQVEREARTAVMLRGPGVVRVFDADPTAGWLTLEWLPRGSLRDMLSHGVSDVMAMSRWIPQLLSALERVHAADLIHADIKPANVLFRSIGEPLLSDFGSCRRRGEANAGGTPGYLAPERLDGSPADPRDDVYAVGRLIEDVLAAREDAKLPADVWRQSEVDARLWARVAIACLAPADERPANATALRALTSDADAGQ
jgi:serine/threonine-protein kinase